MVQKNEPQACIRPVHAVHTVQQSPQAKKPEAVINKTMTMRRRIAALQ